MTLAIPDRSGAARALLPDGFPVLEPKLAPPRARAGIVARRTLVTQFDNVRDIPIVLAVAPAGYGKSTALSQWGGGADRQMAWLSLDRRDADLAVLIGYIAVALDRGVTLPSGVFDSLRVSGPSVWTTAVPTLGAAIAEVDTPFALVLDEVELASQEAFDVIVTLARQLPPGSQIVLASRSARLLPVSRLLASGVLSVIDRSAFMLADREAGAILSAAGAPLRTDQVHRINAAAEGWAAGVYLTGLSIRSGRHPDDGVPEAVTMARLASDYMHTEILADLPEDDRRFLLRTSILERLSPELCDWVLQVGDSGARLEELERSNLFVVRTDEHGEWYRVHSVLREVLRTKLLRTEPQASAELYARAAAWQEQAGDPETAIEYAMVAGDEVRVGRLLAASAQRAFNAGRIATVRNWYQWLQDRENTNDHLEACTFASILFAMTGDAGRAELWAANATNATSKTATEAGLLDFMDALLCRNGIADMRLRATRGADAIGIGERLGPAALALRGAAEALDGDHALGDTTLEQAAQAARTAGGRYAALSIALTMRAWLAIRRGDWNAGETFVREARQTAIQGGHADLVPGIAATALAARIGVHRGAIAQARADAALALRQREILTHGVPWLAIRLRLDLCYTLLALSDPAGARLMLAEIRDILARRPGMEPIDEITALEARVASLPTGTEGANTLTMSELRLLPLLATHLTFPEIGDRLGVTRNTIKTHANSIYRKVDAESRSQAIERAVEMGLLEAAALPAVLRARA